MQSQVVAPARVAITRRATFSASHRVFRVDWTPDENRRVLGATSGPRSHGHNYELEVTLAGPLDPSTGMLVDLKWLKDVIEREVESRFDHRDLNDDTPFFSDGLATAERLATVIFELLDRALPDCLLARVVLRPTEDLEVEVVR